MKRKPFYKTRRGWGAIVALLAFGVEAAGIVPVGTVVETINQVVLGIGGLVSVWGAVQADTPMGIK